MRAFNCQRVGSVMLHTGFHTCKCVSKCAPWKKKNTGADAGPFKVKYLVNTGHFKYNLQSDPLTI